MLDIWGVQIAVEVEDLIEVLRAELKESGSPLLKDLSRTYNNLLITCPIHKDGLESKPSMGVLESDTKRGSRVIGAGTCNCFTCGAVLDLPTLVSTVFGYNDKGMFGYKWIVTRFMRIELESRPDLTLSLEREKNNFSSLLKKEGKKDSLVESSIKDSLAKYRFNHEYMYERKLTQRVIDYFDIGYDKETQAITFPVFDLEGEVALIQRRSVYGKKFYNDEGGNKGDYVYGLYQAYTNIHKIEYLYITESPIDALTLWGGGRFGVSTMGALMTQRQAELLNNFPIRSIVLAHDNDEAGEKAKKRASKLLKNKLLYEAKLPEGIKDINQLSSLDLIELELYTIPIN